MSSGSGPLHGILVAGKSDLANPDELYAFRAWAHTLSGQSSGPRGEQGCLVCPSILIRKDAKPLFPMPMIMIMTPTITPLRVRIQLEKIGPIGQKMRATAIEVAAGFFE